MYYANLAEAFQIPEAQQNELAALLNEEEEQKEVEEAVETGKLIEEQRITRTLPCKCRPNFDMNHFIIILLLIIIFFKK